MSQTSGVLGSKYAALGAIILGAEDYGVDNNQFVNDSATVAESIGVRQTFIFQTVNDTVTTSEIFAASRDAAQGIYSGVLGSTYSLLGSFVLGDLDPQISPYHRAVSDNITVSETIDVRNTNPRIIVSDTVTVAETVQENEDYFISVSDSVHVSETIVGRETTVSISLSDSVHCTDIAFGRNNTIRITVTDSIHSTDGGAGRDTINRQSLSSFVHVVDTTIARDTNNRVFVTDTVHVVDTIFQTNPNVNPIDYVHVSESITFITSFVFITVNDNVHVTETLHCNPLDMLVVDNIHVSTDYVNIKFYITPLNIGLTDGVSVREEIIGHGPVINVSVFDTVTTTEVILTNRPLYKVIDTITVTDLIITSPHVPIQVFDTVTCYDTVIYTQSPIYVEDIIRVNETIFEYTKDRFMTVIDFVSIFDSAISKILAVQKLVDVVHVNDQINLSNARQLVTDTIQVSDNIHYSPISISMSDSVTVSDKAQRLAFLVQDHITVSEHIGSILDPPTLIQRANVTDTVIVNQILFRTVIDHVQVNEFMNLHGSIRVINIVDYLPINDGTRTTSVGGKTIPVPILTGVIVNPKLMQLTTEDTQIQLPAALLGDGREVVGQVNVVKAMEGTTRQFIQQTARIRLTYKWKLSHIKVYELRAFVIASLSKLITITDWNGVIYVTQIVKNPFEFENQGVYKLEKEFAEVEMVFEGIKISGD